MELKNHLGIIDSYIIEGLVRNGFKYTRYAHGENFGWQKSFLSRDLKSVYVHCDFENKKLSIFKNSYGEPIDEEIISIPDGLIKDDEEEGFIEWLDEKCEPYLRGIL